jgi:16S rRNA pseudouridine516 synthase
MSSSGFHRLDRFIAANTVWHRGDVRLLLAQKRIVVDGVVATDCNQRIGPFTSVILDDETLQQRQAIYLALHKPVGVVSATVDDQHRTVIDLLREDSQCPLTSEQLSELHIVGRLDLNSSGLLLLTNNSEWSRQLAAPESKVEKRYLVTLAKPVTADYIAAFAEGMYFPFENITTRPARLEILNDHQTHVTLTEGRYHQIKRMFGRFRNPVLALHRLGIGPWQLGDLAAGKSCLVAPVIPASPCD